MTRLSFLFLFSFFALCSYGQSFIGSIVDQETKKPIPFAAIRILEIGDGVIADSEGHFFIRSFPDRKLELEISSVGYDTRIVSINLSITPEQVFELSQSHLELKEVVVSVPSGKLDEVNIVNVENKFLTFSSVAGSATLSNSLSLVPGVEQITTGAGIGKPVIRGLSGSRIVVYTQNIRLENQQFGDEHGLGENGVGIGRIEVIKGPASLLYGADALGGVVYMVDEDYAVRDHNEIFIGSQYQTNAKTTQSQFGFKTSKEGLKWNVFSAFGSSIDSAIPDGNRISNTRFDEMSMKTSLGYAKNNWVGNLRYSYLVNDFGIPEGEIGSDESRKMILPSQHVTQHNLSLENNAFFDQKDVTLILGFSSNHREEFEESLDMAELDMLLTTMTYQLKAILPSKSKKLSWILGLQGMNRENKNSGEELLIPDATTNDIGGYSLWSFDPSEKLKFQGGMRSDYRRLETVAFSDSEKTIPELNRNFTSTNFSLGGSYQFAKFTFRVNVSTGFRPPNTAELLSDGVHEGTLRYELGAPNLSEENATQSDISLSYKSEHLLITANPFYNKIDNYIFLSPTGGTIDGADLYTYSQADARLWGGEVGLHYHPHTIHWLHIESNYSRVKAKDGSGNPLPLIPASKFSSKLSAEIFLNKENITGNIFIEYVKRFKQERVALNETKSDGYGLLNIGFDWEMKQVQWRVGVENLMNLTYVDHLSRLKPDEIPNPGRNMYIGFNLTF
ncbi:MAG: TonB-dependent receptor [Cytophagales bacterium]|nr:TonB-dependent receptor [Cytophagales bacterium]